MSYRTVNERPRLRDRRRGWESASALDWPAVGWRGAAWPLVVAALLVAAFLERPASGAALRTVTIGEFLSQAAGLGESNFVQVQGTVTHIISDRTYFLQDGGYGVYAFHKPDVPLSVGDRVEVVGNPSLGSMAPTLQNCRLTLLGKGALVEPVLLAGHQSLEVTNAMKLVRVRGRLAEANLMRNRALLVTPTDGEAALVANFEALPADELPVLPEPGSLVEVTGVLNLRSGHDGQPTTPVVLCRSRQDLVTLAGPSLRSRAGLLRMVGLTAVGLVLSLAWVWTLRRQVRRQTAIVRQKFEREAALRESEDRFAKAFRASPDPVIITREMDERIMDVNPAFERMTGYSRQEVLDRCTEELGGWASGLARANAVASLKEHGAVANLDFVLRTRLGKEVFCLSSAEVIEINGERCWLMVLRDVTERRLAEEEKRRLQAHLQESQKMEALGTLAGGISHDFNNLLGAILGNVEMARCQLDANHPVRESVEEIAKAGLRARDLVQQILLFSRHQPAERTTIDLSPVVRDAVKLLRATIPSSVDIREAIDVGVPPIRGNASQIQQIIMNLGTNAWHAMEDRPGRLTIELASFVATTAEVERVTGLRVGRYASLKVIDQGVGMSPETRARVFEPFFTTKQPGKGTGLGLPAVHGIVRDHEGVIQVESTPGIGSIFSLFFPADPCPDFRAVPAEVRSAPPSGQGERIMVIDDESMLVEVVVRLLGRMGYRPAGFTDVSKGLARFESDSTEFDLVVTDLNMPTIPGLQLIARIRGIRRDIPVILASGFVTEDVRRQAAEFGAVTLVNKPVTGDELAEAIHRALDDRRAFAARDAS